MRPSGTNGNEIALSPLVFDWFFDAEACLYPQLRAVSLLRDRFRDAAQPMFELGTVHMGEIAEVGPFVA